MKTNVQKQSLRYFRVKRKLSLQECSEKTNIPLKYVRAIENLEWKKLPDPVYAQSFIERYARVVKISPKILLSEYKKATGKSRKKGSKQNKQPVGSRAVMSWVTLVKILFFGLTALYIGYIFYLGISPPYLKVTNDAFSQESTESNVLIIEGTVKRAAQVFINSDISVLWNETGKFSESVSLKPGLNTITLSAESRFGKKVEFMHEIFSNQEE